MDLSLPEELVATPLAPVVFVDLDQVGLRGLFTENRGADRVPIRVISLSEEINLPQMKPKRNSYEWFIPKGILKQNWMKKHLYQVPSVAVIFMEIDWNDAKFEEKKMELASRVQMVRDALSGRTTKVAVVLVQNEASSSLPTLTGDDGTASERASSLCCQCEISNRSLFILPKNVEMGYVMRLENAIFELAQNYYHQEIRSIKSHRDYLNKTTHLYLFVRHQFKIGFLNELKRDLHTAQKHYSQGYNTLMEVRATDSNIMEVKTVAGFFSFKICKLAFRLNAPRDAISHFRKHMDIFHQKVGSDDLQFEHKGWQSKQCEFFAHMFDEAIKNGLPAIQTQHPGIFYQQAAQYARTRRELAEQVKLNQDIVAATKEDPLANLSTMEFFGQRPWRANSISLEPPNQDLEQSGIQALVLHEKKFAHSEEIIGLLQKAIDQFRVFKSPRSESHLTVIKAEELKAAKRFSEALDLLKPVMNQYREEGWRMLLDTVMQLAVKCALNQADIEEYIRLNLDLASTESLLSEAEKQRIVSNLHRVLTANEPMPNEGSNDGLDSVQLWQQKISQIQPQTPQKVDITGLVSFLKIEASFNQTRVKANEELLLTVSISNQSPLEIPLKEFKIELSNAKHNHSIACQSVILGPHSTHSASQKFLPTSTDVGKTLSVTQVTAVLASDLPLQLVRMFEEAEVGIEVEQRVPRLQMQLIKADPSMVEEWFAIDVQLENEEDVSLSKLELKASLADASDPIISDTTMLSLTMSSTETEVNEVEKKLEDMSKASKSCPRFYIKSSSPGSRLVKVEVTYSVQEPESKRLFQCCVSEVVDVNAVEPFKLDSTVLNLRMKKMEHVLTDETFLFCPTIENCTSHVLVISDIGLEARVPVRNKTSKETNSLPLHPRSKSRYCIPLVIQHSDLIRTIEIQDVSLGKLLIRAHRKGADPASTFTTTIDLPSVKVSVSSASSSLELPAFGIVRTPMPIYFKIQNRTRTMQEYVAVIETSEAFMFSGNKHAQIKIAPRKEARLNFILYPLLAGERVELPVIHLQPANPASPDTTAMMRSVPRFITVLPNSKGHPDTTSTEHQQVEAVSRIYSYPTGKAKIMY